MLRSTGSAANAEPLGEVIVPAGLEHVVDLLTFHLDLGTGATAHR